jgi:hypothetical protein
MLPNESLFRSNRNKAAVVTVKRTLRERWREVAEELMNLRAPNVFLFTTDEDITAPVASGICNYNIYLVLWERMKAERFPWMDRVLGYTQWATEYMLPLRNMWPPMTSSEADSHPTLPFGKS